ncbi:MAG: HAD-IA family hydrolase [Hyphomicrobium sp.]|nr:HAD-IA family hydrolase [Hyphomicrobium sp.]
MKLVILDCDGTIVDSQNGIWGAMQLAFSGLGLAAPTRAETLAVVGLSLPEAFEVLAKGHDDEIRAALPEQYRAAFREIKRGPAHHVPLFEGMRGVIEQFSSRDDLMLGIATGKSRRGIDRLFEREGWTEHFHTIQTADDHLSKPHPAMVHAAMAETGVGPTRTVMVGDTTFDMEMAVDAGVGALGPGWGYPEPDELLASGALAVVETCRGLPAEVDAVFARQDRVA